MSRPVSLDFEAIDCVIREAIEKNSSAWKDIMSLILSTVEKGDRIVLCAEKVFAEYGFHKAKVSEIAGLAGVAEGSIYDFFENKEDLFLSITEARLKEHMEFLPETFHTNTPP